VSNKEKVKPELSNAIKYREKMEVWGNPLKSINVAKMEESIALAVTNLIDIPDIFYNCTIKNIKYGGVSGKASLSIELSKQYKKEEEQGD